MPKSLNLDYLFDQSVFVARLHLRRGSRGRDRRLPHRADDPAVPGLVAEHADRRHLHPAVDPRVDQRALPVRPDAQRDDAGRPGAGRRHPGGRCDGRDREQPPPPGHGQRRFEQAILDGAAEVATPAIVATLSICIVFVPIFLLTGVGGFLFSPLAMSVVFAMLASYLLSRTLVPTMFLYLMPAEVRAREARAERPAAPIDVRPDLEPVRSRRSSGSPTRTRARSTGCSSTARARWSASSRSRSLSLGALPVRRPRLLPDRRRGTAPAARAVPAGHADRADGGLFPAGRRLHPPGDPGRRDRRDQRQHRPAEQHQPGAERQRHRSGHRTARSSSRSTRITARRAAISRRSASELPRRFPELEFFTQPADIVSQILNFGLPAPIDIQISGPIQESDKNYGIAQQIAQELSRRARRRGRARAADPRLAADHGRHRPADRPAERLDASRTSPTACRSRWPAAARRRTNFWLNYKNGVSYPVVVQTPQYRVSSMDDLHRMPIAVGRAGASRSC